MRARVGLVFGADQNRDGSLGVRSTAHCRTAIAAMFHGEVDKLAITVGGKWKHAGRSMGAEMKDFLRRGGVHQHDILFYPTAENGAGEAEACIEFCEMRFGVDNFQLVPIISEFYKPRMEMILKQLGITPADWIIAWKHSSRWIRFMERLKYANSRCWLRCKRVPLPQLAEETAVSGKVQVPAR